MERMIYRPSLHHCVAIAGDVASTSSNYHGAVEVGFGFSVWQTRRSLAFAHRAYGGSEVGGTQGPHA